MGAYQHPMRIACPTCRQEFDLILRSRYEPEYDEDEDDEYAPEHAPEHTIEILDVELPCGHLAQVQRADWDSTVILSVSPAELVEATDIPIDVREAIRRTGEVIAREGNGPVGGDSWLKEHFAFVERTQPFLWRFRGQRRYAELAAAVKECAAQQFYPQGIPETDMNDFQVLFVPGPCPDEPGSPDVWQVSESTYAKARLSLTN
jgi:hypothetical protein